MDIKILGTGCPNCQKLEAAVKQALAELKMEAVVEKVTEVADIASYGVMSAPALVVDGEVKVSGRVPDQEEIKDLLLGSFADDAESSDGCGHCSCGGGC